MLIDPSFAPFNETSITDEEIVNNEGFEIWVVNWLTQPNTSSTITL